MGKWIYIFVILTFITCAYAQSSSVSIDPLDYGIKSSIVTLSDTRATIPATAFSGRKSIIIKNLDSVDIVYIGGDNVTADETITGGFPLSYHDVFQGDLGENNVLYGVLSTTAAAKVSVMEVR